MGKYLVVLSSIGKARRFVSDVLAGVGLGELKGEDDNQDSNSFYDNGHGSTENERRSKFERKRGTESKSCKISQMI